MNRRINAALFAVCVVCVCAPPLLAKQKPQPAAAPQGQRISVCSLLPKEEVKKHIPWIPLLDSMKPEEEPIGTAGSSCNYPSVHIQVLPFTERFLETAKKKGGLETIAGVGDEAYFHNNRNHYAELYVRVGKHMLTLQASVPNDGKIESVKPGVLSLAKALVTKLS